MHSMARAMERIDDHSADEPAPKPPLALPPAPSPRRRWLWPAIAALILVAILVVSARLSGQHSASSKAAAKKPPEVPVVASTARTGDIGVYFTGLGTVTPLQTVTVKTRVDGQLMAVHYKEGQRVKKGDPLLDIDPRPFQVQLAQAQGQLIKDQAALQNARTDLERYQQLIEHNAVAQQVLQTQKATVAADEGAVKTDQANIDSANLNITYSHIVAGITGRVGLRLVDPGNMVSAGSSTPLAVIAETQPISVIFTIPEQQVADVRAQLAAGHHLTVDAISRDLQSTLAGGELTTIDNEIDQTTGTLRLRATFPNRDEALFPNQFVNARLLVRNKTNVTLVPNAAVQRNSSSTFVYVVQPDKKVTIRPVTLGTSDANESEVVKGLKAGETVVTQGVDRLEEGTLVSAQVQKGGAVPVATTGQK
jgi:multidrug efflux system membrane fusion protein